MATVQTQRDQFRRLRATAEALGCPEQAFKTQCLAVCLTPPATPAEWLAAAELVVYAWGVRGHDDADGEPEGPSITEPWEVAYGPREYAL